MFFFEGEWNMQDDEIVDAVLSHLQGYVLDTTITESEYTDLDYDKKVSSEEVLTFYHICVHYAKSYMNRMELPTIPMPVENDILEIVDPIVEDAIIMWTAGKLWQKYNVRVNNNEDDTNTLGYGDKLVIQAKEMLKQFKYYDMKVY